MEADKRQLTHDIPPELPYRLGHGSTATALASCGQRVPVSADCGHESPTCPTCKTLYDDREKGNL